MNVRRILRAVLLGVVLSGGSILGVPMRPEEIEELMSCMNKPNIEVTVDDQKAEDDLTQQILEQMR
jgi:hypothetical protein